MNFHWPNFSTLCAVLLGAVLASGSLDAAPVSVGQDVAVLQIQIGKERALRQVVLGLYDNAAPATVSSFKKLAESRFYNGIRFHRAFPNSLVQTGDPLTRVGLFSPRRPLRVGTGGPGFTLPAEIRAKHVRGAVAMARLPDSINPTKSSNGSQFYVCLEPFPKLDGQYTVFGEVLEGLDVLDEISNLPADSNDFPLPNVVIRSITIQPRFSDVPSR